MILPMNKSESLTDILDKAVEEWRTNKGRGTVFIPSNIDARCFVYDILQRFYMKSITRTLIIVPNFTVRAEIIDFLTHQNSDENNSHFKKLLAEKTISVYTHYFVEQLCGTMLNFVTIFYKCDTLGTVSYSLLKNAKFKLAVLDRFLSNYDDMSKLYEIAPLLSAFKENELHALRLNSPIEETLCGVRFLEDSENAKLLEFYNSYINASMCIFGNFDRMNTARVGTSELSSAQICYQIAYENGWQPNLDMSQPFNVSLDEMYNPNKILERAIETFDMIRNRTKLLTDNTEKLEKIADIVKQHPDEKILIISKRGEFASQITDYLNNISNDISNNIICGNYHDKAEPIPATDAYGNPVYIKTGNHAGERKMYAAQAQKTMSQKLFNSGTINILSTNNSPDKTLSIPVDIVDRKSVV